MTWRFEKANGTEAMPAVEPEEFSTQGDAESWIGETWKLLLDGGVDQVRLFEDDMDIYGPMSLHAAIKQPWSLGNAQAWTRAPPIPSDQRAARDLSPEPKGYKIDWPDRSLMVRDTSCDPAVLRTVAADLMLVDIGREDRNSYRPVCENSKKEPRQ